MGGMSAAVERTALARTVPWEVVTPQAVAMT